MGLRVLHVIAAVAPRYGGPSTAVVGMCRALRGVGVETLVATTDADGSDRLPVPLGTVIAFGGVPAIFFRRQWSEALKYSRPLGRWLEGHVGAFDLVHVHGVFSHACLAAARSAARRGIPYLVRPLGMLDPWSLRRRRVAKRALWRLGVDRLLGQAAAIHYTTADERRRAERLVGLARGAVVPLGVDPALVEGADSRGEAEAPSGRAGARPYVLVLGRLHPKKGLEPLIEAFLDVTRAPELSRWCLLLAGDGDPGYVRALRKRTRGDTDRVRFLGWIDGERKHAVLAGASLLALPSYQENFGLAAAEAMACGVPVLLSAAVNLADDVRKADAGWVTSLAPAALRDTLATALADDARRRERGAAGRALVNARFTWPRVAETLVGLYTDLVARARAA